MTIYIDIDGTICNTNGTDYASAAPWYDKIDKINKLYDNGHYIVYWTARGSLSSIDYYDLTHTQLMSWGAKFHKLLCDKPFYDIFIDDRTLSNIEDIKI